MEQKTIFFVELFFIIFGKGTGTFEILQEKFSKTMKYLKKISIFA
jgi:hypothetical protein